MLSFLPILYFTYLNFWCVSTIVISSTVKSSTAIPFYLPKYDYQKDSPIAVIS